MSSLFIIRGPLCRPLPARPCHILKRYKFTGRTKTVSTESTTRLLPTTPARTRFAPSPTGYVHIGSLRTALYNYLLAKATGGQFLLRVEDTDQGRIVPDAEKRLYEDLKWAGLSWDEGPDVGGQYGPYKQSERLALYDKYADHLLNEGRAYRCFCTPEDLDHMKSISIQEGKPTVYNRTCSHISPDVSDRRAANGEPHCVRFKCDHWPLVQDFVFGRHMKPEAEDDFIIIKRDGYPTYHFANVVDDHLMEITHVIRGAEWLVSTPKHVALYEAFGWKPPQFGHVGLLVNEEKQKLSKRHGDVDIASWRDRGILPITLLNYVLLLGWSLGKGVKRQQEAMNLDEMVSKFTLAFTKGNITVNNKHEYLQKVHVKRLTESVGPEKLSDVLIPALETRVEKLEEERRAHSTKVSRVGPLGPLVPLAHPQQNPNGSSNDNDDAIISREYIRKVLQSDIQDYKDADSYVDRTWYLIWQIPNATYRSNLTEEVKYLRYFYLSSDTPTSSSLPLETEEASKTEKGENSAYPAIRLSELVLTLRDLLQEVPDDRWTKEAIEEKILPFIKSVHCIPCEESEPNTIPTKPWGYHLLRWVIAASTPGSAMIPSMVVLGKEETMRRVEKAHGVLT
ncbi:uncharacterized protein F4822DRAFT_438432 [Hypoxylon trugodes]|uniref:uncharacterized protein n=1 Tax=Hypoxylon trugodes TaxID=326681 RepID=UPI002191F5BD|nr:uncharacterized protein F4822DRAFT_438432 [Hypoxylon trugodes]KAI1384477.1 hypothetical protein F4822DRAFT_438432 [Hypoxylon trugodes]